MHVQLLQPSPVSLSCRLLGALSTWSPTYFWSHRYRPCRNCRAFGTRPWAASSLVEGPSPGSALSGVTVQTWKWPSCRTFCAPTWCPRWCLLCMATSPMGDCSPPPAVKPGHPPPVRVTERQSGWSHLGSQSISGPWKGGALLSVGCPECWWCLRTTYSRSLSTLSAVPAVSSRPSMYRLVIMGKSGEPCLCYPPGHRRSLETGSRRTVSNTSSTSCGAGMLVLSSQYQVVGKFHSYHSLINRHLSEEFLHIETS